MGEERDHTNHWWFRLLKTKMRTTSSDTSKKDDSPTSETQNCVAHTRNSFRRSLKRMHSRMKGCIFRQKTCGHAHKSPTTTIPASCSESALEATPFLPPPPVPYRPLLRRNHSLSPNSSPHHRIPTDEIQSLARCYWYWGPMSTAEADEKLKFKPDGAFLVRDSSSASYLFTISFRSVGKTMHARIEYNKGKYSLYGTHSEGFATITELVQDAISVSENGVYCYSRRRQNECDFPVRLTKPMSRYTEVRSLKYLCKFVIRQCTSINDIEQLPLPTVLYGYLLEGPYF